MQAIGTVALALWALVADPHARIDNIDRWPAVGEYKHCTAFTYVIEFTVPRDWCGFDVFHVARCGLAIHDNPRPCDPEKRIFIR